MSLPGFSEDVPAKRDFAGDPVTAHKGIWLTDKGSQVDHEMNRMSLEQGVTIGPPPPSAHGGTDLRTIQMQDGSNAYDRLQELSAQPVPGMPRLKEALGNLINTDAYKNAPDGASNTLNDKTRQYTTAWPAGQKTRGRAPSVAEQQLPLHPGVRPTLGKHRVPAGGRRRAGPHRSATCRLFTPPRHQQVGPARAASDTSSTPAVHITVIRWLASSKASRPQRGQVLMQPDLQHTGADRARRPLARPSAHGQGEPPGRHVLASVMSASERGESRRARRAHTRWQDDVSRRPAHRRRHCGSSTMA